MLLRFLSRLLTSVWCFRPICHIRPTTYFSSLLSTVYRLLFFPFAFPAITVYVIGWPKN